MIWLLGLSMGLSCLPERSSSSQLSGHLSPSSPLADIQGSATAPVGFDMHESIKAKRRQCIFTRLLVHGAVAAGLIGG